MITLTKVGKTINSPFSKFKGLSSDTKPLDCKNGSEFIEMDTKQGYIFDEENSIWHKFDFEESGGGDAPTEVIYDGGDEDNPSNQTQIIHTIYDGENMDE